MASIADIAFKLAGEQVWFADTQTGEALIEIGGASAFGGVQSSTASKYFQTIELPDDTPGFAGVLFKRPKDRRNYIIINLDEESSISLAQYKQGTVAICNVTSGEIHRISATKDAIGRKTITWTKVKQGVPALLLPERLLFEGSEQIGPVESKRYRAWIASGEVIQEDDRYIASGETRYEIFKVEAIDTYRYNNINWCLLGEDTR